MPRRPSIPVPVLLAALDQAHPRADTELVFRSPYELTVAVLLSAQMTDLGVNRATPALFAAYPDAGALARATPEEVDRHIAAINFHRTKSRHLVGLAKALVDLHGGHVPRTMGELLALPGIGRKSANVILSTAYQAPVGIAVDTHVGRVARRVGLTKQMDPAKVERALLRKIPRERWTNVHHQMVLHGRYVCVARTPKCDRCPLQEVCPSAFRLGAWMPGHKNKA